MADKKKEQMQMLVLALIFIITGYLVFFMYFLSPQLSKSKEYENKIAELRDKIRKIKMNMRNKGKIDEQIKNVKNKIADFELRMPRGDESWSIEQLDKLAKRHGVIIKKLVPETITEKGKFFEQNPRYDIRQINVDVLCTYHTFGAFINALENSSPFLKVKSISITKGKEPEYKHKINFKVIYLVLKKEY